MKSSPQGEIAAYLDSLTPAARNDLVELDRLIVSWQPQLERRLWQSMGRSIIGYGQVDYRYASGRQGQWLVVGLTARQTGYSLYLWGFMTANPFSRSTNTSSDGSKSARVV